MPVDWSIDELDEASTARLALLAREALTALGRRGDAEAFAELLQIYQVVGENLGRAARTLAENGSWARVADVAGTSRQGAWSRWRI